MIKIWQRQISELRCFVSNINVTFCDILKQEKTASEVRKINLTENIFYENKFPLEFILF